MFSEFDFDKELNGVLKRNGFSITADQYKSIKDVYYATMKEEVKQYSNYADRVSLVEGIVQQTRQGAEATDILQTFSDVKHFEFYETFMGGEERRRLVNTLKDYGIPLDALKGVRVVKGGDGLTPYPRTRIDYSFAEDNHGSIYLEYFTVEQDGEIIFDFENEKISKKETPKERPIWKNVEGRKSAYGGRIPNTYAGDVKMWTDKNGRIFYTDRNGHRVKVRNGVVQERILWEMEE